tara:strand:+ start:217 stop:672 length:456 start_codon:yes stop_codon:yes gene_type:complete
MAVSQNIARLRALMQGLAVTGVKSLGVQLLQLESTESVSGGGGVGDGESTDLSTSTLVSIVTTSAQSGSVTLGAGNSTGQIKYVVLGTLAGSQSMKLSCSAGTGGTALTASLNVARTALGLIYDGTNWQLLGTAASGSGVVGGTGGVASPT